MSGSIDIDQAFNCDYIDLLMVFIDDDVGTWSEMALGDCWGGGTLEQSRGSVFICYPEIEKSGYVT